MQSNNPHDSNLRDPEKWEIAKSRASFRPHLATYIVINAFLWAIWFFTDDNFERGEIPWPAWSTAGWGIGLLFHYLGAFVFPRHNSVQREYEKLMKERD